MIAHYDQSDEALTFANSVWAAELCRMGTSCPDHFLRTRICPMFVPWNPDHEDVARASAADRLAHRRYREEYAGYYRSCAQADSPALRDANPSVVVIPALGVFGFGKDKREARITTEFFVNAVHVMAGATALEESGTRLEALPQARRPEQANEFKSFHNYVALPRREAFRIEYWALEEAKLQRMPAEREFSRKIALVVGGGSGIGREVALPLAGRGAHVVVADQNESECRVHLGRGAAAVVIRAGHGRGPRSLVARQHRHGAARDDPGVRRRRHRDQYRGDLSDARSSTGSAEAVWARTLHVNVTGNYLLAEEAARVLKAQNLPAAMVFTSSANAIVAKAGSEAYDASKAAVNHLIRELAIGLGPFDQGERHRAGHGHRRIVDVPARSRHRRAAEVRHRVLGRGADRSAEDEAGGVLRPANDHAPADSAAGLRERDLLAGRRREREDHRTRDPGRRRAPGSISAVGRFSCERHAV